jgi:hypothetical protein
MRTMKMIDTVSNVVAHESNAIVMNGLHGRSSGVLCWSQFLV